MELSLGALPDRNPEPELYKMNPRSKGETMDVQVDSHTSSTHQFKSNFLVPFV